MPKLSLLIRRPDPQLSGVFVVIVGSKMHVQLSCVGTGDLSLPAIAPDLVPFTERFD